VREKAADAFLSVSDAAQHLDIRIPMAPSIRVTLGTDASVEPIGDTNNYEFKYEPNFNWGITETWFHGMIEVNTAGKEVKYSKTFDLDSLAVKVNGVYDYDNNVPYFGFKVLTTSGVSSPANSNGFSVCKKFTQSVGPIKATADVQTSVQLGEQKYNPAEKKMMSSRPRRWTSTTSSSSSRRKGGVRVSFDGVFPGCAIEARPREVRSSVATTTGDT